jgi:hypothetical protein
MTIIIGRGLRSSSNVSNSEKRRKHPIYPLVYEHKNMLV